MALRDTLTSLLVRQEQDESARKNAARTLQEWQLALEKLFAQIKHDLAEYIQDGSLIIE